MEHRGMVLLVEEGRGGCPGVKSEEAKQGNVMCVCGEVAVDISRLVEWMV